MKWSNRAGSIKCMNWIENENIEEEKIDRYFQVILVKAFLICHMQSWGMVITRSARIELRREI